MPSVRTPPERFSPDRLVSLLADAWGFVVADLSYAAVGFGSHHWVATGAGGARWFVTLDDLAGAGAGARLARLRRALETAYALHDQAELSFVVAPLPCVDGSSLSLLEPDRPVAVFPFVEGASAPSAKAATVSDRATVVDLLAQLHAATPTVRAGAGVEDFAIPERAELEQALTRLPEPWPGGPFSEQTRELLASAAASLRARLSDYDQLVDGLRSGGADWVITHGEPKSDNMLLTPAGLKLVDWDTALVAPAARDLWMIDGDSGAELSRYLDLTGRRITREELVVYRLQWELADIASFVCWLGGPHTRTPDTEIAWQALSEALSGLTTSIGGRRET